MGGVELGGPKPGHPHNWLAPTSECAIPVIGNEGDECGCGCDAYGEMCVTHQRMYDAYPR